MSEWQPAVIVNGHADWGQPIEAWTVLIGKRVRIRPMNDPSMAYSLYGRHGCDGKVFEVNPEDANTGTRYDRLAVCEHEILTD